MHDPSILAFSIRFPFPTKWPSGDRYYRHLLDIWHQDPERDGSDDSCGWSYPRLTKKQKDRLDSLAWSEAHDPLFQRRRCKRIRSDAEAESLMRGVIVMVARVLGIRIGWEEVCLLAVDCVHKPLDNFRGALCHLPGYHTNSKKDSEDGRRDTAYGLFCGVAKHILRQRRPWWKHPRWHVVHWRWAKILGLPVPVPITGWYIRCPPWTDLVRRLFGRCHTCKKSFLWGGKITAMGTGWDSGETNLFHPKCLPENLRPMTAQSGTTSRNVPNGMESPGSSS